MEINSNLILGMDDETPDPIDYKGSSKAKTAHKLQLEQNMLNNIRMMHKGTRSATSVSNLAPIDSYWEEGETLRDLMGGQENYLAEQQGYISKILNSFGQAAGTFGTTVASSAATLLSIPYHLVNEAVSEGDQSAMDDILNNPVVKGISDMNSFIQKELLPTYYSTEQRDSLLSAATGTNLLNGVGFLLSAIVPNSLITKGFGGLAKTISLSKAGKLTASLDEAVAAGTMSVKEAESIGKLANFINKSGEVTGALVGRLGESAMEASDTYQRLIDSGADEETAKSMRDKVFFGNMLLGISDFNQATRWFNRGSVADDIIMSGGKAAVRKKGYGEIVKDVISNAAQEAGEEGFQYLLQESAQKTAKGGDFVTNMLASTKDLFTTTEGQKSMLLGAILGGGASAVFEKMNSKEKNQHLNNLVNEVNNNPSFKDRYIINQQGERVLNPEFVNSANRFLYFEMQKKAALANKDKEAFDLAENAQFADLVASRKRVDGLEDFITELEALGKTSVAEMKAMFGELPIDSKTGNPMTPAQVSDKYVAEARRLSKVIDNIDNVPQFANLSPQGKNLVIQSLMTQDAVKKSYKDLQQKVNELQLSESPLDVAVLEDLKQKSQTLEKQYERTTNTLKEFLAEPAKVENKAAKIEEAKQKKEENIIQSAEAAFIKAKHIADRIDGAAKKTGYAYDTFKIVTPDSQEFNVAKTKDGKDIIVDANGKDVTVEFHEKYGEDYAIRQLDYDEEGDVETEFEDVKEERNWKFKKESPFTTAGRNSTKEGTFNSNGDRRNLWLSKGRQLFYDELNNTKDPLSLKLEIAPEWMYDELFVDDEGNKTEPKESDLPVIIGYLYRKGKVVEKDGQKAYTVLHTANLDNASRFETENVEQLLEEFQVFRDTVEDRFNKGQDSFVYITDISSGFINITQDRRPLKDLLNSPVVKTGGISIVTSMLSNDKKKPAIIVDGKDVKYVRWSGRPYIRVKVGESATGPVYEYQEMNTRLITEKEVDEVILPLILQYLEGNDTVTIDGQEATILSYKSDPSVLDAFLFFGQSKFSEATSLYFGKGPNARTLYFGKDENGAKISVSKNNKESLGLLREFLLSKKRHINKKYSSSDTKSKANLNAQMNIPTFGPEGPKMHKISYLNLIAGNGPFEAGVSVNISAEGTVLNKYATFEPDIRENPNTALKVKPRRVIKEVEKGLENEPTESVDLTKPLSNIIIRNLSEEDGKKYIANMIADKNFTALSGASTEFDDLVNAWDNWIIKQNKQQADNPGKVQYDKSFIDFAAEFYKDSPEKFTELKKQLAPKKAIFGKKPSRKQAYKILNTSDLDIKQGSLVEFEKKDYVVLSVDGTIVELVSTDGKGKKLKKKTSELKSKGVFPVQSRLKAKFIVIEKGKGYIVLSAISGKPVYEGKTKIAIKTKRALIYNAKRNVAKVKKEIPWEITEQANVALAEKINDALETLLPEESVTEVKSVLEEKKADIEKRRQEELNNQSGNIYTKIETYEGISTTGEIERFQIRTAKNGTKSLWTNAGGGRFSQLGNNLSGEVSNDIHLKGLLEEGYTKVKEQSSTEYFDELTKGDRSKPRSIEEKINAQYDAELAALEIQEPQIQEQIVTENPNEDLNKLFEDDLFARQSDTLPYKVGNVESAKSWVMEKLGVEPVIAEGLIKIAGYENALFGHFYNGVITLSNAMEEGTEYHEAFHLVSQMYLSFNQRSSLYKEVRQKNNDDNLTDRECEEILAEDFREFVMTDGKVKYPEVQKSIFQKMLDFIKKLLGLNVETVNEVFAKINEGYYNKETYINRLGKSKTGLFTRTADLPKVEFTPTQHHNINEALFVMFRSYLIANKVSFYKVEVKKNLEDFEKMAIERFASFPNSVFNADPEWFLNHFKDNVLKDLGVNLEISEEDSSRDNGYNEQYGKVSSFVGISDKIKFLFSSVVDITSAKNEYGLYRTVPMSEVKAFLTDMLHDQFSYVEMIETLSDIVAQTPKTLFETKKRAIAKQILDSVNTLESDFESTMFKLQFFDAMTLAKQPVITTLYYANGTANVMDAMQQTIRNRMREFWGTKSMMSDYISVINGQRFITKANAEKLLAMSVADFVQAIGLEIRNDLKDKNTIKIVDTFRKAFFKLPSKIIETGDKKVPQIQGYSAFMFNLEDYISETADTDKKVREAISEYRNILNELLDLELPLYNSSVEAQMKNSDGETLYGYVKPSYLYQQIKNIKEGVTQTVLNKGSLLWESIKHGKVKVAGVDGQRFAEKGEDGQHISTYTAEDMLLNRIVNFYSKNIVQFLQMADKKFVFGLELNNKDLVYSPNEVNYSDEDKLKISLDENHRAIERLYEIYQNYQEFDKQDFLSYYNMNGKAVDIFEEMNGGLPFKDKKEFAEKVSQYLTINYLETLSLSTEFLGVTKRDAEKSIISSKILESISGKSLQEKLQSAVAGLVLTEFVNNFETMNVFFGSPSQYKDLFKRSPAIRANGRIACTDDFVNQFLVQSRSGYKMTPEQLGLLPTGEVAHHFRSIVGKDLKVESKYSKEYQEILKKNSYGIDNDNEGINPADAQGMVTFEFYREYSIRTGQWTQESENAFWKELEGENTGYPFPPMKLVHFGPETNDQVNVYYKFSVYPLTPSLIKGRSLENLRNKLYNTGASMYVFESGNKVGKPKVTDNFYSNEAAEGSTHMLNVADLKIQVDISAKGDKYEQLFGTQIRKLILQNLSDAGTNIQNADDIEKYNQIVKDLISLEVESLADTLEISSEDLKSGNLNSNAWKHLIDLFKESALEREESDNVIIGLDYLKDQSLTIDVLPTRDKIQNLMNSLINNRIQKQYMRGRPYVQASSVGFEYNSEESLNAALKRGEILKDSEFYNSHFVDGKFDSSKARLGFLTIKEGKVQSAEILLPYMFKEMFQDINQITPELLEAIGYRIPTQGLNSMLSFKVVGFLPKSADQIAAVPYEITMQSGSDFDVDKINTFLRNYFYNKKKKSFESIKQSPEEYYASKVESLRNFINLLDSKISKEYEKQFSLIGKDEQIDKLLTSIFGELSLEGEFSEEEVRDILEEAGFKRDSYDKALAKLKRMLDNPEKFLKKYKKLFLQESLFDIIRKRLLDVDRFKDYINPNSSDSLEEQARIINDSQTKPYKATANYKGIRQFFTSTNIKVAKNLWSAKLGVGQSASQAVFTAITQLLPITQAKYSDRMYAPKDGFYVNEQGNIFFGKKDNTAGESIIDILANQHITANVDAANKPFIFQINANGVTNDLHYYLTAIGLPVDWISRFMSQPIIIEYVKEMEKRKSMQAKLRRILFNEQNTENDIIAKVRAKFNGTSIPSEFLNAEEDEDGLHIPSSNDNNRRYGSKQLLEFIEKPGLEQLNLLDDFLFYKEWAAERRKIISSIKFDTMGAGKNLPEARISEYKYNRIVGDNFKYSPRKLYTGVEELVNGSVLQTFKENVLDLAIKLYENTVIVEKQDSKTKQVLEDVFDILYDKSQLNSENIYKVYAMLTNIILQNNLVETDIANDPLKVQTGFTKEDWWKENMLSSRSIARQVASLIRSDVMKGNYLFDNLLTVDFATKDNEPDIIKFDNTVKIDTDLEHVITDAFIDLKQKNPKLYFDLIKVSFFQTGVVKSVVSFYQYIPVEDFVLITRNLLKEPIITKDEMMAELVKNMYSIKGLANKVGKNDIVEGKEGLPDFFTVKIDNKKYEDAKFLTKTYGKNIALYQRGIDNDKTIRFDKTVIKSNNKFNNGLLGQDFEASVENEENLEETEGKSGSKTTLPWDNLTVALSKKLSSIGITETMFNSLSKEEQDNIIKCNS